MFSALVAYVNESDKSTKTDTEAVSEISIQKNRDGYKEFDVPEVKLKWDEIYVRISTILAVVEPVKYYRVISTDRNDNPLIIEGETEEIEVFGQWVKSGKDCMAVDKDGVPHWFVCDADPGTLLYSTTFSCDFEQSQ